MEKIISLFQRNYDGDRQVRDEVVPGAEWVLAGEGWATRKLDGTCCKMESGRLWKRYTVKGGRRPPVGFVPATDFNPKTKKQHGWMSVGDEPDSKYHLEALGNYQGTPPDGTYELIGPKIQGNPEGNDNHVLIPHSHELLHRTSVPRDFEGIKYYLDTHDIEGIVWCHEDGRMVKIKGKDFGLKRKDK